MEKHIERRVLFDSVADLYDELRPGYPDAVGDEVVAIARVPADARVLEVGTGTGQATRLFAARGFGITSLELGARLAERARENLAGFPNVEVLNTAFEDWPMEAGAFDLVISGSAFHWIPPEIGFARCAGALKPSGYLALFWNTDPKPAGPVYDAVQAVYERVVPEMTNRHSPDRSDATHRERIAAFEASGYFEGPVVREYPWVRRIGAEPYSRLICTYSDHIALPDEQRAALCAGIREAIDANGGVYERRYVTRLYVAQKRTGAGG